MKLNYDCVRDVLLELEENLAISDDLKFEYLSIHQLLNFSKLKKYSKQDIFYALYKLNEADYINASIDSADDLYDCTVCDITYYGHEFLQSIKSENIWTTVKNKCKNINALSFSIITNAAANVISSLITG